MEAIRKKLGILKEEKEQALEDLDEAKKDLKEANTRADQVSMFFYCFLLHPRAYPFMFNIAYCSPFVFIMDFIGSI